MGPQVTAAILIFILLQKSSSPLQSDRSSNVKPKDWYFVYDNVQFGTELGCVRLAILNYLAGWIKGIILCTWLLSGFPYLVVERQKAIHHLVSRPVGPDHYKN